MSCYFCLFRFMVMEAKLRRPKFGDPGGGFRCCRRRRSELCSKGVASYSCGTFGRNHQITCDKWLKGFSFAVLALSPWLALICLLIKQSSRQVVMVLRGIEVCGPRSQDDDKYSSTNFLTLFEIFFFFLFNVLSFVYVGGCMRCKGRIQVKGKDSNLMLWMHHLHLVC